MKWQDILKNELATIQDTIDVGDVIEEEGPCNRKLQAYVKLLSSKMSPQAEEFKKYLELFKGDLEEYGLNYDFFEVNLPKDSVRELSFSSYPQINEDIYLSEVHYDSPVPEPVACKLLEMIKKRQTDTIQMGDYKLSIYRYGNNEGFRVEIKNNLDIVFSIFVKVKKYMPDFDMPDGLKDRLQKYVDTVKVDWWV